MWCCSAEAREVCNSEGIKLINRQTIKEVDDEGYKYLGILALDKFKEREMKENESEGKINESVLRKRETWDPW